MKHVQACLSAWKEQESSFHHCVGCSCKPVYFRKILNKAELTSEEVL